MATFSKKQLQYLKYANKKINLTEGSVSSGKTYITSVKSINRLASLPKNFDKAIFGKTKDTIKRNILSTYEQILGNNCYKNIEGGIEFLGHRIWIVGLNDVKAVSKIKGMTLCYALGDEITEWMEDHFKMVMTRLRTPNACFDGTTNPASPNHWMYKTYKELIGKPYATDEFTSLFHFGLDDNLTLTDEYKNFLKSTNKGAFYQRYIEGLWVIAEGLVYDEPIIKPYQEFLDAVEKDEFIDFFYGVDWGWNHPTAITCWAVDREGRYWLFKELKKNHIQAEHVIQWLREVQEEHKRYFRQGNADNSRPEQNHILRQGGFIVYEEKPEVKDRIAQFRSLNNGGNIIVCDNCPETLEEFGMYRYPTQDELLRQKLDEDKPLKENDDLMDSGGYAIFNYETSFGYKLNRKINVH